MFSSTYSPPAVGYPQRGEAVKVPGHSFRVRTAMREFFYESTWADSPNRSLTSVLPRPPSLSTSLTHTRDT